MRNIDFLKNTLIAHRGIHYNCLENTLYSFNQAIQMNKIIELDVRMTKDNVIIVFHDSNLKRIFGINRDINDLTIDEIKKYYYIPTLKEVLKQIDGVVPIIIEIKIDTNQRKLEKLLGKILVNYKGKFAIQSFNPLTLFYFRLNYSNFIRGYLVSSILPKYNFLLKPLLNNYLLTKIIKPDFIAVNIKALKDSSIQKLKRKYFIIGYTIKSKEEHDTYVSFANNFICDFNEKFK